MPEEGDDGEAFRLILAPGARRALTDGLPAAAALAAWELITGPLLRRPHAVGAPLRARFLGLWRARRGEYRVRYRIDERDRVVYVLDVDHRRDAYRILGQASTAELPEGSSQTVSPLETQQSQAPPSVPRRRRNSRMRTGSGRQSGIWWLA